MDFADEAQVIIENHIERSLKNRKTLSIPFSGACLSCEEPVKDERRFCCPTCRSEWEQTRYRKFSTTRNI